MSGVQVPPPLPKNFNEIDQNYQSYLIYSEFRIRINMLICQSVCDREFAGDLPVVSKSQRLCDLTPFVVQAIDDTLMIN